MILGRVAQSASGASMAALGLALALAIAGCSVSSGAQTAASTAGSATVSGDESGQSSNSSADGSPSTEAAGPTVPKFGDFPEPAVGGAPAVFSNTQTLTASPDFVAYSTVTDKVVTGLSTATLMGEPLASVAVTTTPTLPAVGASPDLACGFDVRPIEGVFTIITSSVIEHAATDAQPASYDLVFQGFDRNLQLQWTTPPIGDFATAPVCTSAEKNRGGVMADGDYVVRNFDNFMVIVDLVAHEAKRSDLPSLVPWGERFLASDGNGGYLVINPATLRNVGYIAPVSAGGFADIQGNFDEYDGNRVFASGDGLAIVDLGNSEGTWVIQPNNPAYGFFRSAYPIEGTELIAAQVADTSAPDAPTSLRVLTTSGEQKWSMPNVRVCGIRDGQLILDLGGSIQVMDAATGAAVTGPLAIRCDGGVSGYVVSADGRTQSIYRIV